jgi:hypothetical protein
MRTSGAPPYRSFFTDFPGTYETRSAPHIDGLLPIASIPRQLQVIHTYRQIVTDYTRLKPSRAILTVSMDIY